MRSNHNHYTRTPNSAFNLLFVVILLSGAILGTYMTIKDDSKNTDTLVIGLMNTIHDQDSTMKLLKDSLQMINSRPIDIDTVYIPRPVKLNKIVKDTAVVKDTI